MLLEASFGKHKPKAGSTVNQVGEGFMKLEGQVGGDRDKRKWGIKGLWASEPLGLMLLHRVTDSTLILHSIPCSHDNHEPLPSRSCIQFQI